MQYRLTIVSPWVGTGVMGDGYRPQFEDDYNYITWAETSVRSAAEYFADPNLGVLACEVDDATLAALEADTDYYILSSDIIQERPL